MHVRTCLLRFPSFMQTLAQLGPHCHQLQGQADWHLWLLWDPLLLPLEASIVLLLPPLLLGCLPRLCHRLLGLQQRWCRLLLIVRHQWPVRQ